MDLRTKYDDQIRQLRQQLVSLVSQTHDLTDPAVLSKSAEIDRLIVLVYREVTQFCPTVSKVRDEVSCQP